MARPVASFLASFDAREPDQCAQVPDLLPESTAPSIEDQQAALEAAREEGFAAGLAEGIAAERAESDAKLAQEKAAFEVRLAEERAVWARNESAVLAEAIGRAVADMEARVAASVAKILRPFLTQALRRKAVEALIEDLRLLEAGAAGAMIEISGPEDLLGELQQRLSETTAAYKWRPAPSVDVSVIAGPTTIETQLEAWLAKIAFLPE
jgi:hypothetical protein